MTEVLRLADFFQTFCGFEAFALLKDLSAYRTNWQTIFLDRSPSRSSRSGPIERGGKRFSLIGHHHLVQTQGHRRWQTIFLDRSPPSRSSRSGPIERGGKRFSLIGHHHLVQAAQGPSNEVANDFPWSVTTILLMPLQGPSNEVVKRSRTRRKEILETCIPEHTLTFTKMIEEKKQKN